MPGLFTWTQGDFGRGWVTNIPGLFPWTQGEFGRGWVTNILEGVFPATSGSSFSIFSRCTRLTLFCTASNSIISQIQHIIVIIFYCFISSHVCKISQQVHQLQFHQFHQLRQPESSSTFFCVEMLWNIRWFCRNCRKSRIINGSPYIFNNFT